MALQGVLDIGADRALLLLHDHAEAEGARQNALRLIEEGPNLFTFVTTYAAEQQYRECHRLQLKSRPPFNDWRNFESWRDKAAVPILAAG